MRSILSKATVFFLVGVGSASTVLASEGGGETLMGIPTWIWKGLNLALFIGFLAWVIGKPLKAFLVSRAAAIKQELEDAQHKLEQAEEMRTQVLARLEQVETEVRQIKERADKDGQREAEKIDEQAKAEEQRFLKRVEDEIDRRQAETRYALAEDTVTLTAQIARELLEREMTDDDRKRVLERSLNAMQTMEGS